MALKNTNTNEEYPYAFMVSQRILQTVPDTIESPAEYSLSMCIKFYKIVGNNIVFDETRQLTIDIDNFNELATTDFVSGDNTHVTTLNKQQLSIKKILEDQTSTTFEVV